MLYQRKGLIVVLFLFLQQGDNSLVSGLSFIIVIKYYRAKIQKILLTNKLLVSYNNYQIDSYRME